MRCVPRQDRAKLTTLVHRTDQQSIYGNHAVGRRLFQDALDQPVRNLGPAVPDIPEVTMRLVLTSSFSGHGCPKW